jgi:hypothetical protein
MSIVDPAKSLSPSVSPEGASSLARPVPKAPINLRYRTNDQGLIEGIDVATMQLVSIQASTNDLLNDRFEDLIPFEVDGRIVYLERGVGPGVLGRLKRSKFSPLVGDLVAEKIVKGKTLTKACEELNLDYGTVTGWIRDEKSFGDQIRQAKLDRGDTFFDKSVDTAENSIDTKLKVDVYKWAAEKSNPAQFGNQTKLTGDKGQPLTFVIETGIRREVQEEKDGD